MIQNSFFTRIVFSLLIFLLWTLQAASAGVLEDAMSQRELVVSTSLEYAPQTFLNEKGKFVGFDMVWCGY